MKDFLLEHYKQVNERLTHSDRNRDVWVGAYLVLMVGSLSFAITGDSTLLKFAIPGFLFVFGSFIATYTAFARAWHCEYTCVLIAVHRSFLDGELDLLKAAKEFKQSKEFGHYFNAGGTEFMVFLLVLLTLSFELVFLLWEVWIYFALCLLPLPFLIGIPTYKRYLKKREGEFPEQCHSIQTKAKT